jgi:hypothetical protein
MKPTDSRASMIIYFNFKDLQCAAGASLRLYRVVETQLMAPTGRPVCRWNEGGCSEDEPWKIEDEGDMAQAIGRIGTKMPDGHQDFITRKSDSALRKIDAHGSIFVFHFEKKYSASRNQIDKYLNSNE